MSSPVFSPMSSSAEPASARRRVRRLVMVCVAAAVAAIVLSTRFADAGAVNPETSAPGAARQLGATGATVVIVQPGETLWRVARALQPTGDVRPLVARLTRSHGGSGVQAGDRLSIPPDLLSPTVVTP